MVRLDSEPEFITELEEEVKPKVRKRQKKSIRSRLKLTCCLFFLMILFFLFLIVLAALAKTGLVEIPLFSKIFYQIPRPTRLVEVSPQDLANFSQGLKVNRVENLTTLEISEKELTFLLQQLLAQGSDPFFAPNVQAVISSQQVELFGLLLKPVKTNVTIKFIPQILDGQLNLEIKEFKAGNLSLPQFLVDGLINSFLKTKFEELSKKIEPLGEIKNLELLEGKIVIEGNLNLNK